MLNKKLASAGPSTSPGLAQLCNRFRMAVAGLGEVSNAQHLECPDIVRNRLREFGLRPHRPSVGTPLIIPTTIGQSFSPSSMA